MNANEPNEEITEQDVTDLIGIREAARLLPSSRPGRKRHYSTVYRWVHTGKLRGWKMAGQLFVRRSELLEMLKPVGPTGEYGRAAEGLRPRTHRTAAARRRHEAAEKVLRDAGVI